MIEIKIQCDCGKRYRFNVEPLNGRMPSVVRCPACGAEGTEKANDILRRMQGGLGTQQLTKMQEKHKSAHSQGLNLNLADIYHVLFRQKWVILSVWAVGIIAVVALHTTWRVPYSSYAKIWLRYIQDTKPINPSPEILNPISDAISVINAEIELINSGEVALGAAEMLDPDTLNKLQSGTNKYVIAAVIQGGLSVASGGSRNPVIHISYTHLNPAVVQPVLTQVIESYKKQYVIMHHLDQEMQLTMTRDDLKSKLARDDEELRKLKEEVGVTSLADTKRLDEETMRDIQREIWSLQIQLDENEAIAKELTNLVAAAGVTHTNIAAPTISVPSDKKSQYNEICDRLDDLQRRKRELLLTFTESSRRVKPFLDQIVTNQVLKAQIEAEYPQISMFREKRTVTAAGTTEKDSTTDLRTLNLKILALQTQLAGWKDREAEVKNHMNAVADREDKIKQLQSARDMRDEQLATIERKLFHNSIDDSKFSGIHFSNPSIPMKDPGKINKILLAVLLGAIAAGLALAFAIEFYFDRSFKRPIEIENKLGIPLFLSIPETTRNERRLLATRDTRLLTAGNGKNGDHDPSAEVATWRPNQRMQPFFEALRDRLITHFEVNEVNHKPKLVAVTSCAEGSGVSTVASGLAASLSETGEGNVLLVDMNEEGGAAHLFHKGKLACGLDEILENGDKRERAQVEKNLFVVTEQTADDKLPRILHKRFSALIPKLHASDFDYIIFDMPPISQTSATTRVARFMDMTFMVVEAEKTDSDIVKRASKMLTEAKAGTVGVVLNKSHNYVPRLLNQEL